MGLHLISSNRVESLQRELSNFLVSNPLANPFIRESIVVPGLAMARWLNLQLARQQGVAANIDYPQPASWVWQIVSSLVEDAPEADPLSEEIAAWKIFELLPELIKRDEFDVLRRYLADDEIDVKRWQLSARIASVFGRYQFYRPEWISEWDAGRGSDWQAVLWRELAQDIPNHRVSVTNDALSRLASSTHLGALPERVTLFALSSMPPLFVNVVQAVAAHTDVFLCQHSPSNQYWADLISKKAVSRKRVQAPDEAAYYDTGNDLIASWGRQGQAFQDLLLDDDALTTSQWEDYQQPGSDTLLHRIQQDIFELKDASASVDVDHSLQIGICYSPMRECQVLHDQLLHEFQRDNNLKPEDVLVMVPEISRYAPYIDAVFHQVESASRPYIPWNLSDITLADEHPLIGAFFQLLELPSGRFTFSEILSLLDVPELIWRFGLDRQSRAVVSDLLVQANLHWGLDGEHKAALGLPPLIENTWKQAEQRLFAGYAMGETEYWDGIAPIAGAEGDRAQSMGRFWLLFDQLRGWQKKLERRRSASAWRDLLNQLLDDFFSELEDQDNKLQQIRNTLDDLHLAAGSMQLNLELVCYWLKESLNNKNAAGRFFSGGVTFCGMRPMRSLPFKVICLIGMNDQAFPRRDKVLEFDRLSEHWRQGDPRNGDEDRYLLLETLLCARQKLYISYTGRSLHDNSECQPSVLVRELIDYIDTYYSGPVNTDEPLSQRISHVYPMHPFSARNYRSGSTPAAVSYDRYWYQIAAAMMQQEKVSVPMNWPLEPLAYLEENTADLDINRLSRFLQHPIRYFFNTRLKIWLREEQRVLDEEPFLLDGLQQWSIKSQITNEMLLGQQMPQKLLQAQGVLPHGGFATQAFDQIHDDLAGFTEQLGEYRALNAMSKTVDLPVRTRQGVIEIGGQIANYFPGKGILHFSPANLSGKHLLAIWLEHLAICAMNNLADDEISRLICIDQTWQFTPVAKKSAMHQLADYAELYGQGLTRPLPVFPNASYAWASSDAAKRERIAKETFEGGRFGRGDVKDDYIRLAIRGVNTQVIDDPEFAGLADRMYALMLASGERL